MAFGSFGPTLRAFFMVNCLFAPATAHAFSDPTALCRDAAAKAARETGVPYEVLLAITIVETGRDDQPWPWTVNFGGDGQWYDSEAEAARNVDQALSEGATNVDLGCFQLNYRWHASAFASLADMMDPVQNASYAAEFLSDHYARTGDWAQAAAAYHSGTPEFAEAYRRKFEATYDRVAIGVNPVNVPTEDRQNRFPLLVAGSPGLKGSLFPSATGGLPLIGGP
jgi:hypothetical protein